MRCPPSLARKHPMSDCVTQLLFLPATRPEALEAPGEAEDIVLAEDAAELFS